MKQAWMDAVFNLCRTRRISLTKGIDEVDFNGREPLDAENRYERRLCFLVEQISALCAELPRHQDLARQDLETAVMMCLLGPESDSPPKTREFKKLQRFVQRSLTQDERTDDAALADLVCLVVVWGCGQGREPTSSEDRWTETWPEAVAIGRPNSSNRLPSVAGYTMSDSSNSRVYEPSRPTASTTDVRWMGWSPPMMTAA